MPRPESASTRATDIARVAALACLAALVSVWVACSPGDGGEAGAPRRIVLVVLDTLRADHLALYGYERDTAPWLEGLASEGVVFDRAHSTTSWPCAAPRLSRCRCAKKPSTTP